MTAKADIPRLNGSTGTTLAVVDEWLKAHTAVPIGERKLARRLAAMCDEDPTASKAANLMVHLKLIRGWTSTTESVRDFLRVRQG